jgi:subtilisin-like proprotein convertase family protein
VTKTATVNQCVSVSSPIISTGSPGGPVFGVARIPVSIPALRGAAQPGAVTAFTSVDVRITHTRDEEISLLLVSPAGTVVPLAVGRGGAGDDFGSGATSCSGTPTLFTDAAGTPISAGVAPFAASFRPEQPLAGLVGGQAGGTWTLFASDTVAADDGTLHAFSLSFTYSYKELMTIPAKKKKKKKKKKK